MTAGPEGGGPETSSGSNAAVRRAIRWYLIWSVVALVAVSLGVILASRMIARDEALRDADRTARAVANTIVAPLANSDFHAGDARAVQALSDAMTYRSRDGSMLHIKIWEQAGGERGRILWADEPALIGQTFDMEEDEFPLFGTDQVSKSISDLSKAENALERSAGELVEVYAGFTDASGSPLLFEAYIPTSRLEDETRSLINKLLPLTLGALLLLSLATLPLAISLARRVDRAQTERRRLLQNAVASSDLERKRIAQDLHDGVIQDLAGVGYALSSLTKQVPDEATYKAPLERAGTIVRSDVAALRTLMTDIYPPDLEYGGLAQAVRELLAQNQFHGANITVDIDEPLTPSPTTAQLAFRVVRESLRNVAKHARPQHVAVRLSQDRGVLLFSVEDDGVGFDTSTGGPAGHLGLRLIQETVADAGGRLEITSAPGAGTLVSGRLPL